MADEKEVKLLYVFPSPFVLRVVLALEIKGISYEIVPDDLVHKSPLLLQSNPLCKKFPVLIHKNRPICDSRNIIQYLDEAFPQTPKILSSDPFQRSSERFLAEFVDNKILATAIQIPLGFTTPADLAKSCELFEEELSKLDCDPYLGGDKLGFVDVVLVAPAIWARDFMLPLADRCPRLHKLLEALRENPAVKSVLPDADTVKTLITQAMPMLQQLYGNKANQNMF